MKFSPLIYNAEIYNIWTNELNRFLSSRLTRKTVDSTKNAYAIPTKIVKANAPGEDINLASWNFNTTISSGVDNFSEWFRGDFQKKFKNDPP